jgi:hypothetical protein
MKNEELVIKGVHFNKEPRIFVGLRAMLFDAELERDDDWKATLKDLDKMYDINFTELHEFEYLSTNQNGSLLVKGVGNNAHSILFIDKQNQSIGFFVDPETTLSDFRIRIKRVLDRFTGQELGEDTSWRKWFSN